MEKNKFQTIAQFLGNNPNKVSIRNGKLNKIEFEKWSQEEEELLIELMEKRTVTAIRVKLWRLMRKHNTDEHKKINNNV